MGRIVSTGISSGELENEKKYDGRVVTREDWWGNGWVINRLTHWVVVVLVSGDLEIVWRRQLLLKSYYWLS